MAQLVARRQCRECGLNRQLKFYVGANGRVCTTCQRKKRKLSARLYRVLKTYELTADDYWALYAACGGRCMICHGKRKTLDIEHDHARAITHGLRASVRGLVCARENRWAIPGVAGDPSIARAVAVFLERPPAHNILGTGSAPPLTSVSPNGARPGAATHGRRRQGLHQSGRRG